MKLQFSEHLPCLVFCPQFDFSGVVLEFEPERNALSVLAGSFCLVPDVSDFIHRRGFRESATVPQALRGDRHCAGREQLKRCVRAAQLFADALLFTHRLDDDRNCVRDLLGDTAVSPDSRAADGNMPAVFIDFADMQLGESAGEGVQQLVGNCHGCVCPQQRHQHSVLRRRTASEDFHSVIHDGTQTKGTCKETAA